MNRPLSSGPLLDESVLAAQIKALVVERKFDTTREWSSGLVGERFTQELLTVETLSFSRVGQSLVIKPLQAGLHAPSEKYFFNRLEPAVECVGESALRPLHELMPLAWEVAAP